MKRFDITFPEILHSLSFLLYLFASAMTLIEHGVELSLWLMTFAVVISAVTTIFPWLGIRWLALDRKGCQAGHILAVITQIASWMSFGYAMLMRLARNMDRFYSLITLTTLLWAVWMLIFIYSRHACVAKGLDDKLNEDGQPDQF